MGGGKETPRQKLIGLMYLVLMALLAMNVSKSILNAFITINEKFEHAAELTHETTEGLINRIDGQLVALKSTKAAKADIKKVEEIQKAAEEIRKLSKGTSNFFIKEAADMITTSDNLMPTPFYDTDDDGYFHLKHMDTLSKKDDYDTPPHIYLLEGTHEPSEKGLMVEKRLFDFRDSIVVMAAKYQEEKGGKIVKYFIDPSKIVRPHTKHDTVEFRKSVDEALKTVHPDDRDRIRRIINILTVPEGEYHKGEEHPIPWIATQFDHAVIVAAATVFTSLMNDVKMAEALAIETVSGRATAPTFKFNKVEPLAFASTSYINQGDSLNLKVMIAAYDSTEKMELHYWIDDTTRSKDNMKKFKGRAGASLPLGGSVGEHVVVGTIAVKEKGVKKWKPWKFKYSVGAPNAAVAAADLNVLYRGWDNKLKVSASGYDPSTVSVSASGGVSISKKGDFYIAKVKGSAKKVTINVTAKDAKGNSVSLAQEEFRVFPLPAPQIYFANQSIDKPVLSRSMARKASKLVAKLGNSPLNVPYEVTQFNMIVVKNGKMGTLESKSAKLTGAMKAAIKKMPSGSMLTFSGVKARKVPGGKPMPIGGIAFKLR